MSLKSFFNQSFSCHCSLYCNWICQVSPFQKIKIIISKTQIQ